VTPEKQQPQPSTSKQVAEVHVVRAPEPEFETDPVEINNYNLWHQSFYNRPSVFAPNPPPRLKVPPPDIMSQITVAARYVAAHTHFAERRLAGNLSFSFNFKLFNSRAQ
jgi:hypothetical protein